MLAPAASGAAPLLAQSANAVWMLNDDGAGLREALRPPPEFRLGGFAVSPDGSRVAYMASRTSKDGEHTSELRVARVDGTEDRLVIRAGQSGPHAWSPDGATLAFSDFRRVGDSYEIDTWTVAAAGGPPSRLLEDASDASWSPDGSRLAFTAGLQPGRPQTVTVMDLLTGARRAVGEGAEPAWSPDGLRLAYVSRRDRHGSTCPGESCYPAAELYVADPASGVERRLTRTTRDERDPSWSPDGTRIAVAGSEDASNGVSELWLYDADGRCPTQLTWIGPSIDSPRYLPQRAESAHGPCGGVATRYRAPDPRRAGRSMLFPGPRFDGALLSDVERGFMDYAECAVRASRCRAIQLQRWSICRRNPALYGWAGGRLRPTRVWRRHGALVAFWPTADGFDVYTGSDTIAVFGVPHSRVVAFVDSLRLPGERRPRRRLAAPRFRKRDLAVIRGEPKLREVARRLPRASPAPSC